MQPVEQPLLVGFRLGVTAQDEGSPVGRRQMNINHLDGTELFQGGPWGEARREGTQTGLEGHLETIGQEGDDDVRFDPRLQLVANRTNTEITLEFLERLFYLARYFAITAETPAELIQRRLDFLNLCPATDLPGDLLPLIANDGATCQPPQLVSDLNQQIRACEARTDDCHKNCRPTGQEWRICATFYDHPYTTYEAPQLYAVCGQEYGDNGYLEQRCTYIWTLAGEAPPP